MKRTVYTCNLCGAEFGDGDDHIELATTTHGSSLLPQFKRSGIRKHEQEYHFCARCLRKFLDWVESAKS